MSNVLKGLADNEALLAEVHKTYADQFTVDIESRWVGDAIGITNEELGEIIRARLEGLRKVEKATKIIESHRSVPTPKKGDNPGY